MPFSTNTAECLDMSHVLLVSGLGKSRGALQVEGLVLGQFVVKQVLQASRCSQTVAESCSCHASLVHACLASLSTGVVRRTCKYYTIRPPQ